MKNLKKIICAGLAATMIFSSPTISFAAGDSVNEKIAQIEIDTYGEEQNGSILNRLSQLEKNYTGKNMRGNMNARIDAIYDIIYNNDAAPGVLAKLNALEWNSKHEVGSEGVGIRLDSLERSVLGEIKQGTFNERIKNLALETFGSEEIPMVETQIPSDTMLKVVLTKDLNSKELDVGDTIEIKVAENLIIGGKLVLAKGLPGEGTVKNVKDAKSFGRNAKLEIDFNKLKSLDGRNIEIYNGEKSKEEMKRLKMAGGASLVGIAVLGPLGAVAGVFVKGKNIEVPAGTEILVEIRKNTTVYALQNSDKLEIADENENSDEEESEEYNSENENENEIDTENSEE